MIRRWERALVTGASSGIGDALARQLAAEGTDLVVVARNRERLEALAADLRATRGIEVEVFPADLTDERDLARLEARLRSTVLPVDLLINNAGLGYKGLFGEIDLDDELKTIGVNVVAMVRLTHAAVTRFRMSAPAPGQPVGAILNVSSTASFQPTPTTANYGATKAYVTSFSQALHEEHRRHGITVTALCPGLTRTEFQKRGGHSSSGADWAWEDADDVARVGLRAVAKGRAVAVSGTLNKSLQIGTRVLPLSAARWCASQVLKHAD